MTPFWIVIVATGCGPVEREEYHPIYNKPVPLAQVPAKPAELTALEKVREEVRTTIRGVNVAKGMARLAATRELLTLYTTIARKEGLTTSEQAQLQTAVANRLRGLHKELSQVLVVLSRASSSRSEKLAIPRPKSVAANSVLAQRMPFLAPGQFGNGVDEETIGNEAADFESLIDLITSTVAADTWDPARAVAAQQINVQGAGQGFLGQQGFAAGRGRPDDNGPALVELIQDTIAPDTWDVRGGPGVIRYFAPMRALVVTQSDGVHGGLADVLGQMRR